MIECGSYQPRKGPRCTLLVDPAWDDGTLERAIAQWAAGASAAMSKRELARYGAPRTPTVAQVRSYLSTVGHNPAAATG